MNDDETITVRGLLIHQDGRGEVVLPKWLMEKVPHERRLAVLEDWLSDLSAIYHNQLREHKE